VWDGNCDNLANQICPQCDCGPGSGANGCCVASNEPGCNNGACEAEVCAVDPSCCTDAWDEDCWWLTNELCFSCGEFPFTCCTVHTTPGCEEGGDFLGCADAVCYFDPFCCQVVWDQSCVDIATELPQCLCCFEPGCPPPTDCNCCDPQSSPGCSDPLCEAAVCALDSFCCEVIWDTLCAQQAEELVECACCLGDDPGEYCDCCEPQDTPGCSDQGCEDAVCSFDSFCCNVVWDQLCADEAATTCTCCP
jgi:hypothetical protein